MKAAALSLLGIAMLVITTTSMAQPPAWAGGGNCVSNYDPRAEVTMKATVEDVTQVAGKRGWNGTHLTVSGEGGTIEVHLGPSNYIEKQQFSFAKGDQIEVTGSKVKFEGTEVVLARQITKDGKTLILRNEQGIPNWSRGRAR